MRVLSGLRFSLIALLAVLAMVALAACGEEGAPSDELAADQTLRVWLDGEPDYIDPSIADFATAVTISKNVFATLLRFDPTTGDVQAYAAQEVPTEGNGGISEDGLTYTFKLREDAVWEDGQPIRSQDFVYSIQRLLDPRVASYYGSTYYSEIIEGGADFAAAVDADDATLGQLRSAIGVEAVDDGTFEVTITRPSNTFNLLMTLWPTAALRQDVIESFGDITNSQWTEAGNLVASGPFRLAQWDHGNRIVMEKNPNFWAEEMEPNLSQIVFQIIEDENTAFAAYQVGQLDAVSVPLASLHRLSTDPNFKDELQRVPLSTTLVVAFNHSRPPFDEVATRRALCQAIDRETLVNEVQQGRGNPTTSWLPPGLVPFFAEDRGKDLAFNLASAGRPAANPESSSETFSGTEFSFANVGPNPTRAEFIQGQWSGNLGIDIKLNPLDPPAFGKAFVTGDFDLAFVGFGEDYHHPENWLLLWTSDGGLNTGGYSNPEFDSTVEAALAETDPDAAVALWQRADEILMDEDVAMCPLMNSENAWLVKSYVRDFIMTGADGHPGDYFYWKTAVLAH